MALAGYAGYAEITLTNPASALTDFTYLLNLNCLPAEWWTAVQGGGDVRVTDESDSILPLDPISFTDSGTSGSGLHAFKFSPASSGTQKIRVWCGKSGESQPAAGDATGQYNAYASHVRAFYPSGGGNDRTSYVNHLTMTGSPTVGGVAGPINGSLATDYDGSTQYGLSTVDVPTGVPLTYLSLGKSDSLTANQVTVAIGASTTSNEAHYLTWRGGNAGDLIYASTLRSGVAHALSATGYTTGWHQGIGRYASATSRQAGIDGVMGTAETSNLTPIGLNRIGVGVLASSALSTLFNGAIAFAEIHTTALSDAWVAYHAAMLDPSDVDQSDFYGTPVWVPAPATFTPQAILVA